MINKDYLYDACYSIYFYLYLDMFIFLKYKSLTGMLNFLGMLCSNN